LWNIKEYIKVEQAYGSGIDLWKWISLMEVEQIVEQSVEQIVEYIVGYIVEQIVEYTVELNGSEKYICGIEV
jgi:hypothetical protein